jgi:hypothetical protein
MPFIIEVGLDGFRANRQSYCTYHRRQSQCGRIKSNDFQVDILDLTDQVIEFFLLPAGLLIDLSKPKRIRGGEYLVAAGGLRTAEQRQ